MDKELFSTRVEAMEGTLYGMARTYLREPADCADAVQDAALKAWQSLHSLRDENRFETWVVRILINECKAILRKGKRVVLMADIPDAIAPEGADKALYEAIFALDIHYRAPFVLFYVEGYSVEEIARMLRLPKGTVTSRLKRAREKVKQIYGGELF
jgi:RNA polymerase sigma factor, sigma-70 family